MNILGKEQQNAEQAFGTFEIYTRVQNILRSILITTQQRKYLPLLTRYVIGADGAKSNVARSTIKDAHKIPYVIVS